MSEQAARQAPKKLAPNKPSTRVSRLPLNARLRAWRDQHLYSFFSSLGRLAARPWATALTVLVLGVALALPLLFFLVLDNARDLSGGMREAREITVFLKPDANALAADALASSVRLRNDVASVTLRTPAQGLAEFRQLSGFGAALDALNANPLPSVLVITPRADGDFDNPPVIGDLEADKRVDLVQYDAAWRRRLSGILRFGERAVEVSVALLALATLLVIGNTVRMDVQTRADEISVMQLLGASNGFVRRPFLYSGLWYGLFGSLLALAIVIGVELALAEPVNRLLESYDHRFAVRALGLVPAVIVVGASVLLGWLGAHIATTRHLVAGRPRK